MSNTTLAVKFRPRTFNELTEQDAIVDILEAQLTNNAFKQAYLFTGPAGCGKTTSARILANEINSGKGNPIEIDAASNNGVEHIRNVNNDAQRKPLSSAYKVFIIDEVHMLSTGAWNAMLKILEEPPETAVFIMCTTDPQKIPDTILSRVQRYDFSKISLDGIVKRLQAILAVVAEQSDAVARGDVDASDYFQIEDEALVYIAKLADGGMRDAISMMEKCLATSNTITVKTVVETLGTVDYNTFFEVIQSMSIGDGRKAIEVVERVYDSGRDIKQFARQLEVFIIDCCKYMLFKDFRYTGIPNLPEYRDQMELLHYDTCVNLAEWSREVNYVIKYEQNAKSIIQSMIITFCKGVELNAKD